MARKLRFFKEQMSKAGISTSPAQLTETPLEFDDLEVRWDTPLYVQIIHLRVDFF